MYHSAENIAKYILLSDIIQGFWTFFLLAICAGVLYAVWKLSAIVSKLEARIDPLAARAEQVLEQVDDTLSTLKTKAETMLDVSEDAVRSVATKVDTTTSLVEGAVARPAISLSSILAGVNRGLETRRHFKPSTSVTGSVNGSADGTSSPAVEVVEVIEVIETSPAGGH